MVHLQVVVDIYTTVLFHDQLRLTMNMCRAVGEEQLTSSYAVLNTLLYPRLQYLQKVTVGLLVSVDLIGHHSVSKDHKGPLLTKLLTCCRRRTVYPYPNSHAVFI